MPESIFIKSPIRDLTPYEKAAHKKDVLTDNEWSWYPKGHMNIPKENFFKFQNLRTGKTTEMRYR